MSTAWRRIALGCALLVATVAGIGYATAWRSLAGCQQDAYRDIQRKHIAGTDVDGHKVLLAEQDVRASVAGPFLVEVSYMVPHDLHGSVHMRRYVVLPWTRYLRSSNVVHLVAAPAAARKLASSHGFQPAELRDFARAKRQSACTSTPRNAA